MNAAGMPASQPLFSFTKRSSGAWYRRWWREPHTIAAEWTGWTSGGASSALSTSSTFTPRASRRPR